MITKKSIIKKLVCLTALTTMLIGSTMSVSAKTKDVTLYEKCDGTWSYVDTKKVKDIGSNGLPVYKESYDKVAHEVTATTPNGVYIYGNYGGIYTPEQMALLYNLIDSAGITNDMTQYDKAVALNNAVCNALNYGGEHAPYYDGLIALQMGGTALCQEYADLYQTACQAVGIDCQLVRGIADNGVGTGPHRWNFMMIDGVQYYVDTTWNDSLNNAYLMLTDCPHQPTNWSTNPEDAAGMYFPAEFRTVQNY